MYRDCIFSTSYKTRYSDFIAFMEQYLTSVRKMWHFVVSYAVPAGSQEVTVVINFVSEDTVLLRYD
jgi:hypothetical protein